MKNSLLAIIALSANLYLIGCADEQARTKIEDTSMQVDKLQKRVGQIDKQISNQKSLNLLNKIDELQNQIEQLNGEVASIRSEQKSNIDTQNQLNKSLDERLNALQTDIDNLKSTTNNEHQGKTKTKKYNH